MVCGLRNTSTTSSCYARATRTKLSLAAVDTCTQTCRDLLFDVEVSKAPNRFPKTGVLNRVTGTGCARDEAPRRHSR